MNFPWQHSWEHMHGAWIVLFHDTQLRYKKDLKKKLRYKKDRWLWDLWEKIMYCTRCLFILLVLDIEVK
jgi:hypothetical protein